MSEEKKPKDALTKENAHYNEKFIATKENRQKVKESFDKSREQSMKGKFDGFVEV